MANTTDTPTAVALPAPESQDALRVRIVRRKLMENSIALFAFLAVFVALGIWTSGKFFTVKGRLLDVHSSVPILILGFAALFALIVGEFDLSIAGTSSMASFLTIGLKINQKMPFIICIVAALAVGVAVGLVNGFLVEVLKVNAFIATLGVGAVVSGLGYLYSNGTLIVPGPTGPQLPHWFVRFGSQASKAPSWIIWVGFAVVLVGLYLGLDRVRQRSWTGPRWVVTKLVAVAVIAIVMVVLLKIPTVVDNISWLMFFMIAVGVVLWILIEYTTFGRHMQAIGSNSAAALLAGVKVRRQVIKAFVCSGLVASIAGISLGALQGSATPDSAQSFLLPAFSAAFLSTVILSDGKFKVLGTVLGGVFVVWVGLGLIVGGLSPLWVNTINGLVLVVAVSLSTVVRKQRR